MREADIWENPVNYGFLQIDVTPPPPTNVWKALNAVNVVNKLWGKETSLFI